MRIKESNFSLAISLKNDYTLTPMEIIPQENLEPEPEIMQHLSPHAQFMRKISNRAHKLKKREVAEQVLMETFDLLGGVAAMAAHYDEHRGDFYPLFLKVMGIQKSQVDHSFRVIQPSIPMTPLDGPIDAEYTEVADAAG